MRTLSSKMVKTGIKNGYTVNDFCTKYGIEDESSFLVQLEKAFPNGGAEQVLREIRQNKKNRRKKPAKRNTDEAVKETQEDILDTLKTQEADFSNQVIDLENQHKELAGKRRDCLLKLRQIQQKVDEICQELGKQQAAYEETANLNNGIVRQMNQVSKARAEKLTQLVAIRAEITKLETTIVAVYEDCNIEIVEGKEISLEPDQSEVSALTHQLTEEEVCENLTIKQIKTLSSLILIYKNTDSKIEFIFDNPDLEKAYLVSNQEPLSS